MNSEERNEYVRLRLESAMNTYNAARILADNGYWNSAVNRLYYAVYYAVNALLIKNNIITKTHSGTRNQFSIHFIKTKKLNKNYGKVLSQLYNMRQRGDYELLVELDSATVLPIFDVAKKLIVKIEEIVHDSDNM